MDFDLVNFIIIITSQVIKQCTREESSVSAEQVKRFCFGVPRREAAVVELCCCAGKWQEMLPELRLRAGGSGVTPFHLHCGILPTLTARLSQSAVVAMAPLNKRRAVNSLPEFKVKAHSHFDLQSMNRFVARSCCILPQVVSKLLCLCAL